MRLFFHIGRYFSLLTRVIAKPEKSSIFFNNISKEIGVIGINSIGIVVIISFFMGAVITLQTALNFDNPLIPKTLIGYAAKESVILEFSSTIVGLILAGKIGSHIASEIGSMRVLEQIDALEIMGVNSANHLILPKIIAAVFVNPFLTIISMFIGIMGGYIITITTGVLSPEDYLTGIHLFPNDFYIIYGLIKSMVFAFIITSVAAYQGYFVKGGALEVGKASTHAVVYSCVLILLFNLLLTDILLT